jgi:hypothetical protein
VIIPILGARRREQIEDTLRSVDIELSEAELKRLDDVSRIELGFPHDFVGRALAYGETFDLSITIAATCTRSSELDR